MAVTDKTEISGNDGKTAGSVGKVGLDQIVIKKIASGRLDERDAEIAIKSSLREGNIKSAGIIADFMGIQDLTRIKLGIRGARERSISYTILSVALFRTGNSEVTAERKEVEVVECLKRQFRYTGKEGTSRMENNIKLRIVEMVRNITDGLDKELSERIKRSVFEVLEIFNSKDIEIETK